MSLYNRLLNKFFPMILVASGIIKSQFLFAKEDFNMELAAIVKKLGLEPHPEGGFFRETYRSQLNIPNIIATDGNILKDRAVATAIYYMVTADSFSALHKVSSDETFHFYYGDPVEMLLLKQNGDHEIIVIGSDVLKDQRPQFTVPAGCWQGTRLKDNSKHFALLGTTVYPGFDFKDFQMGSRTHLRKMYPEIIALIDRYTRQETP